MSAEVDSMQKMMIVLFMLMLFAGCATTGPATVDIPMQKGSPVVYIHPLSEFDRDVTVGVLPFQVPDNMGKDQSDGVATLFKEVLLGKRAFRTVRLLEVPCMGLDDAVAVGKRAGVDFVLTGKVHYAIEGTELGGARTEMSIRLISVGSGNTIWYIAQSMDQRMDYPDLSFGHRLLASFSPPPVRKSAGAPAVPNMLLQMASDMADVMAGAESVRR